MSITHLLAAGLAACALLAFPDTAHGAKPAAGKKAPSASAPASASASEKREVIMIPAAEARIYMELEVSRNPKSLSAQRRLEIYLNDGPRPAIAADIFNAILKSMPDVRPDIVTLELQCGPPPRGALELPAIGARLRTLVRLSAKKESEVAEGVEKYMKRLTSQAKTGSTWYTPIQLAWAEKYEFLLPAVEGAPALTEAQAKTVKEEDEKAKLFIHADDQVKASEAKRIDGWQTLRIRRSWNSVLFDEDPTVRDPGGRDPSGRDKSEKKSIGDQDGALLSYTRDGLDHTDTWSARGALILPWTHTVKTTSDSFQPTRFAFAPSVTVEKQTTEKIPPKGEADSVLYRAAFYADFYGSTPIPQDDGAGPVRRGFGLQARAAAVYGTNWDHENEVRGYEVDLEPRYHYGHDGFKLGYRMNLVDKKPSKLDWSDDSYLEGQLRVWCHLEGGEIQDTGGAWAPAGSFFRLGPTAQLSLIAPALPGGRSLSLTALYSHLEALSGPEVHEDYFRATLTYDLFRNEVFNRKIGISANYERGGLNFSKEEVDLFTLGLSVLF